MSDEAVKAVSEAMGALEDGYSVTFRGADARMLAYALQSAYAHCADGGCPDTSANQDVVADWAADFLSGVAETVGIEMI